MSDETQHHRRSRLAAGTLGLSLVLLGVHGALGQSPPEEGAPNEIQQEYNVKLAYLCGFSAYVTWSSDSPSPSKDTWIIGTLGSAPLHGELDRLAASGRAIRGRKIVAVHFDSIEDYQPCHVLFVAKNVPREQWEAVIRTLRGRRVLIVGEAAGFAVAGGCVNFYRDRENIRFEINRDAVREQELQVSSKLLSLAKVIPSPSGQVVNP